MVYAYDIKEIVFAAVVVVVHNNCHTNTHTHSHVHRQAHDVNGANGQCSVALWPNSVYNTFKFLLYSQIIYYFIVIVLHAQMYSVYGICVYFDYLHHSHSHSLCTQYTVHSTHTHTAQYKRIIYFIERRIKRYTRIVRIQHNTRNTHTIKRRILCGRIVQFFCFLFFRFKWQRKNSCLFRRQINIIISSDVCAIL